MAEMVRTMQASMHSGVGGGTEENGEADGQHRAAAPPSSNGGGYANGHSEARPAPDAAALAAAVEYPWRRGDKSPLRAA